MYKKKGTNLVLQDDNWSSPKLGNNKRSKPLLEKR